MIGKQHFYMRDLFRADYYYDRYLRGKFEVTDSKTRELSLIQYARKNDIKQSKMIILDEPPADQIRKRTTEMLQKCVYQIRKIQ